VVISVVFGILPVIAASRIRPAIILRPNETHIPVAGFFYSMLAMLVVVGTLGVIAGQVVGNLLVGVIAVIVTLLLLGLLVLIMWVIVWLIGRVPSFGNVDLRLALRNLTTRRTRTATTLLALSAGMFALSSITFFGASFRQILNFTLSESLGGNVLVFTLIPGQLGQQLIDSRLDALEGVEYRTRLINYSGRILSVNGVTINDELVVNPDRIRSQIARAARSQDFAEVQRLTEELNSALDIFINATARETTNPQPARMDVIAGRGLSLEDAGLPVAVFAESPTTQALGITVGSRVVIDFSDHGRRELEVVGLTPESDPSNMQAQMQGGDLMLPSGLLAAGNAGGFTLNIAQVQPENLNQVLLDLSATPLVFSLDITFIDGVLSRFITQFSALPVLVGIFSLGAAAVIMANTVALATLERRRQIGILKAVGLRRGRVLRIMLLENTLISLLGGVLGIGLSALGVWIMTTFGLADAILIPPDALPAALVLVAAAILIGIGATLLSAGVAVRERVLNVLRYE
jgi:predicted lysophospholipase L1 biosynthesis ABC-type transport system permease subunit